MTVSEDYAKSAGHKGRSCVQCECFVGWLDAAQEEKYQIYGMCPSCFKEAMEEGGGRMLETYGGKVQPNLTMDNWATILKLVRRELRSRTIAGVRELRAIEDAIIDMAFEKAKGGKDDKA